MKRLSAVSLEALRARGIAAPEYPLTEVEIGIVHFGPGAFHRVHQACYFDLLLSRDRRWGISEVSLQTSGVRDALAPQDGLYALAVLDTNPSLRIIGAAREFLVAREAPAAVINRFAAPSTKIVTLTVTEKGYCLDAHGHLDFGHKDIARDLSHPNEPISVIGYLAAGLRRCRADRALPPLVLSCDNLTDNGAKLRGAVIEFAEHFDSDLARWIANEVAFPRTMVDSITPATDGALRARVTAALGYEDAWPVQREAFTQWVIEEHEGAALPDWRSAGVTLTSDVGAYERAKLRLLNGAHSTLSYLGSLAGLELVSDAMNQRPLAEFIRTLMRDDIAPTLHAPARLQVSDYIESLLRRFQNPMLPHRLAQIALDGSQKIPFRLLGTIADALAMRRDLHRLSFPIAAWFHFLRRKAAAGEQAVDPLGAELFAIAKGCSGNAERDVQSFLALRQIFPGALTSHTEFCAAICDAYSKLESLRDRAGLALLT